MYIQYTYIHAYIQMCDYLHYMHEKTGSSVAQRSQSEAIFILNKLRKKGRARIVGRFIKLNECELKAVWQEWVN